MFVKENGARLHLNGIYKGKSAFLVGGGRSITPMQLELLNQPGIFKAAVNDAAHFIRPNIFYASDLDKIPKSVLSDSTIQKFLPYWLLGHKIYEDRKSRRRLEDYPNVIWCMVNRLRYSRKAFLNNKYIFKQADTDSYSGASAIIMLNILYKLGFKTVYLVGLDFNNETNDCTYFYEKSFVKPTKGEYKNIYKVTNSFRKLLNTKRFFKIYNCSPRSSLDFFKYKDLEDAVNESKSYVSSDIYENMSEDKYNYYINRNGMLSRKAINLQDIFFPQRKKSNEEEE